MRQINLHNGVSTAELVRELNVSEDTIRRDLQELSENNLLSKVHGGAISKSYNTSFDNTNVYAKEQKNCIAKKAVSLIKDGMSILTGGGTTVLEMVKQLPENLHATFFTISPLVANELSKYNHIEVILIGGLFAKKSQITYGGHAITQINEINVDLCILGTSAIHPINGLTDTNWEINQLKKTMLHVSKKVVVVCISEKLDLTKNLKVCSLKNISYLITELDTNSIKLKDYQINGLTIL